MYYLELLFLSQGFMGILMLIFLHKINQMKKQMDNITKEVKSYLDFVEEDVQEEMLEKHKTSIKKTSKEEAENHLIQAVLKEYFP